MERRLFLKALAAMCLPSLTGCSPRITAGRARSDAAALFVPGYHTEGMRLRGEPADSRRRRGQAGAQTLLTRLGADGTVRQAIFPVIGHDVEISQDGRIGFLGRMNLGGGEGAAHHVTFDPETLELIALGTSLGPYWRGGGHGLFLADGTLLCAERAPQARYRGTPSAHYGRLSRRDPMTLAVLDSFSCHGIDPHELRLSGDGRHVVVANYGSVAAPGPDTTGQAVNVVEPAVTVVDLASGRLVARHAGAAPGHEIRHLALGADGQIFAIRAHQAAAGANTGWLRAIGAESNTLPVDPVAGASYLPAAPVLIQGQAARVTLLGGSGAEAHLLEGLSVEYDPQHDEFIATFPSSHRLIAFSGRDGRVTFSLDTRTRGLVRPSGLALIPDFGLYVVVGYWQGLQILERGTHRLIGQFANPALVTGGHSHMTAA